MSFLRSLELSGFKSFAKNTTLTFEPGITGVVGPNGSGKSNIADAIRWVLGEQSKKAVRGKASVDMIFSGTSKKAPMSLAEVSLTFDNSSKRLPYDYEEVVVTRRLYRSGDSEYLVNGAKVRLGDLQHAFAVAGIGAENYTVIGQGLVDQVLSQTPSQRRGLFEEAAGIKQFQLKRDESRRKLSETTTNLGRIADILRELEPRLKTLRKQAAGLAARESIEAELGDAYLSLYGHRFRGLQQQLREEAARREELKKEFDSIQKELVVIDEEVKSLRERQQGLRLHALLEQRTALRDEHESMDRTAAEMKMKIEVSKLALERSQEQITEAKNRLTEVRDTQSNALPEDTSTKKKLSTVETKLSELESQHRQLQAQLAGAAQGPNVDAIMDVIERLENAIAKKATHSELAKITAELKKLTLPLRGETDDTLIERAQQLLTERDELQLERSELKVILARRDEAQRLHEAAAERRRQEEQALGNHIEELGKKISNDEKVWKDCNSELKKAVAAKEILDPKLRDIEAQIALEQQASMGDLEAVNEAEGKRAAKQQNLESYRTALGDNNVAIAKLETRLEDLVSEAKSKLGSKFPAPEGTELPDISLGSEEKISKLEKRLMELGGIDPDVAAEHDAVEQRFTFLSGQSNDLLKAKEDLEKIIAKLEVQSRSVFKESFEKIATEFSKYFTVLFGGGAANLELIQDDGEEERAAEYGIDIKAQPPGKRVQSLAMLSGGERALTSVALLFAILTVNPSPFVMLDEVDAALDEANTSRFADLLGQLSEQTQFIVVTHNRDTMRSAQRLYGVTMDETGISTLLSIKLPEAERVAA